MQQHSPQQRKCIWSHSSYNNIAIECIAVCWWLKRQNFTGLLLLHKKGTMRTNRTLKPAWTWHHHHINKMLSHLVAVKMSYIMNPHIWTHAGLSTTLTLFTFFNILIGSFFTGSLIGQLLSGFHNTRLSMRRQLWLVYLWCWCLFYFTFS